MSLGATDEDTAHWDVPSFNPNLANYGIWGHPFGAGLKQDPIAGVSGYSTRIYGALVGVDNWVRPFFRLGTPAAASLSRSASISSRSPSR